MKNISVLLFGIGAMQSVTQSKLFAQRSGEGFCCQESIGTTFDNELSMTEWNTIRGDLASPAIGGFNQGNLRVGYFLCCIVSGGKPREFLRRRSQSDS